MWSNMSNIDCSLPTFLAMQSLETVKTCQRERFQVMFAGHLCSHVAGPWVLAFVWRFKRLGVVWFCVEVPPSHVVWGWQVAIGAQIHVLFPGCPEETHFSWDLRKHEKQPGEVLWAQVRPGWITYLRWSFKLVVLLWWWTMDRRPKRGFCQKARWMCQLPCGKKGKKASTNTQGVQLVPNAQRKDIAAKRCPQFGEVGCRDQ